LLEINFIGPHVDTIATYTAVLDVWEGTVLPGPAVVVLIGAEKGAWA